MLDEVEAAILLVASSILRGEGFTYTLPTRGKGNQLYVPGGWRLGWRLGWGGVFVCLCPSSSTSQVGGAWGGWGGGMEVVGGGQMTCWWCMGWDQCVCVSKQALQVGMCG